LAPQEAGRKRAAKRNVAHGVLILSGVPGRRSRAPRIHQRRMPSMRSAPLRAVAALGGALGTLPLIPIVRRLAMKASGPPRLMGRELADYDFKSATYAEAFVFLLLVPLAALLFGRALPRLLAREGATVVTGVLPGIVFGLGFTAWRLGLRPKLAVGAGALLAGTAAILVAWLTRGREGVPESEPEPNSDSAPDADRRGWILPALALLAITL